MQELRQEIEQKTGLNASMLTGSTQEEILRNAWRTIEHRGINTQAPYDDFTTWLCDGIRRAKAAHELLTIKGKYLYAENNKMWNMRAEIYDP